MNDVATDNTADSRILYCHCTYAQVVPVETKTDVLSSLAATNEGFDAVADLCEMSARKDPALARYARPGTRIAACYPRAVKWLFHAGGSPLPEEGVEVFNMRTDTAEAVIAGLNGQPLTSPAAEEGDDA